MITTSVGAATLGRGCDTFILDDPVTPNQVLNDSERANHWIDNTARSRLNDPGSSALILIMQRLHELDPTGYLLRREGERWTYLPISLVAEKDETYVFPVSNRIFQRNVGDVLMPERFTEDVVKDHSSRGLVFASQYQQHPAPPEGNVIERQHVRFYDGIDPVTGQLDERCPKSFDIKIISVDCAFKDLATSDYVAIVVIGVRGSKRFILNVVNSHLSATATEAAIRQQRQLFNPLNVILVEDKANGSALIERLKVNLPGVIAVNPEGGKTARLFAAAGEWEAGDWYVNRNASWTQPFIDQITMFPNAANDDMTDAMSQAACWLLKRPKGPSVVISNAFTGRVLAEYY